MHILYNIIIFAIYKFSTVASFSIGRSKPQLLSIAKHAVSIPLDDDVHINPSSSSSLDDKDAWIANLDYDSFGKDVSDLGKQLLKDTGDADVKHLSKIVKWRNIAAILGLATVWTRPNPITVLALSTWCYASWTMIAHHTCHGGYNRVDAGRFNSRKFGLGFVNRCIDWLDWMIPEAWNIEHNRLHHYSLNQAEDPDLVQRNVDFVRDANVPIIFKYMLVALFLPIWKWYYYAPNTYRS